MGAIGLFEPAYESLVHGSALLGTATPNSRDPNLVLVASLDCKKFEIS